MRTHIVRIGNSRGIRIPKVMLEQTGLSDEVDLSVREGRLIVLPASDARAGWEQAFAEMAQHGDHGPVAGEALQHSFDDEEWEWK
jgi:antitoxin MazE